LLSLKLKSMLAPTPTRRYGGFMSPTNLAMAEEALSLPPTERVELAKLLIESLEGERRSDREIKADLKRRLANLLSGEDTGLTFEQVFETTE
jgi:putative addiction module component (TIGR02574 family)